MANCSAALGTVRLAPSGLTVLIRELNVRSPTPVTISCARGSPPLNEFGRVNAGAKLGGEAHDTQDAKARRLDWDCGTDAYRDDRTDAFSFYSFHERRR